MLWMPLSTSRKPANQNPSLKVPSFPPSLSCHNIQPVRDRGSWRRVGTLLVSLNRSRPAPRYSTSSSVRHGWPIWGLRISAGSSAHLTDRLESCQAGLARFVLGSSGLLSCLCVWSLFLMLSVFVKVWMWFDLLYDHRDMRVCLPRIRKSMNFFVRPN